MAKNVIINADDYGLTDGVSRSIIKLFEQEAISNTTVMICVEGAYERCQLLRDSGFASRAGVHLQTTMESKHKTPLSNPSEIPSLVDKQGFFKSCESEDFINPAEIELEWERQIVKTTEALGTKPSHIDSHHGIHRIPELTPIYFKLAKKYDVPVRGGRELGQVDGSKIGVQTSTLCSGGWTGQNAPISELKESILAGVEKVRSGVLEICTHPGYFDEDLVTSSSWNKVREHDYNMLLRLSEENWLEENGINLVKYPELNL